jgi:ribosomal protein L18
MFIASKKKRIVNFYRANKGNVRYIEISLRKTNKNLHAIAYDCNKGNILFSITTANKALFDSEKSRTNCETAVTLADKFANKIIELKLTDLCFFNKTTYKYHGKVSAFVDKLREKSIVI